MKADGEDNKKIASECGKAFFVKGSNIYYISENVEDGKTKYALCKIRTNGNNKEEVKQMDETLDLTTINFTKDLVFYVKRSDNGEFAIYKMNLNGKNEEKITNIDSYTRININDSWVFYLDKNENGDISIFRIKLNGKDKQEM